MNPDTMPPIGNAYMPPNSAYSHPMPLPGWRTPNGIPPTAIPPLQLWHNVIYDCMRRALEDHDRTRTSSNPVGLSRGDAETLLSTFHKTLRASIQKEMAGINTILNENKTSSEPAATCSGITPEETRVIRKEIQHLGDTLSLEFKALSQVLPSNLPPVLSECKLVDMTASWSTTAQRLEGAIQSLQRTVEDLQNMRAQDQAKYWSEIEALRAEHLTAFKRGQALDILGDQSQIAKEIKGYLQEIRGLLHKAQGKKLSQKGVKTTPLHGGPVTRAQAQQRRRGGKKCPSKTY